MSVITDPITCTITESRPSELLAALHRSAHAEREYLFAARDASPEDLILVAWIGEEAVGYIATTDQRADGLLVWEHVVVPSYRGRGLGERLLLEAVRRTLPGTVVEIDPMAELDLGRINDYYRRLGFRADARNGGVWATAADVLRYAADRHGTSLESQTAISAVLGMKATPGVTTIPPDQSIRAAVRLLNDHHIGAVVVSSDGSRVEGILSERDILVALDRDGADFMDQPVRSLTTTDVVTCTSHDPIANVMATMTSRRIRHMPITTAGRLSGMVSIGDLVAFRLYEIGCADEGLSGENPA